MCDEDDEAPTELLGGVVELEAVVAPFGDARCTTTIRPWPGERVDDGKGERGAMGYREPVRAMCRERARAKISIWKTAFVGRRGNPMPFRKQRGPRI